MAVPLDSLNVVDVTAAAVVGVSALAGFVRGLVRDLVLTFAWVGAALLSWQFGDDLGQVFLPYTGSAAFSLVLGRSVVFILSLVLFQVGAGFVTSLLPGGGFRSADRTLGLAFGVGRGVLACLVAYIGFSYFFIAGSSLPPTLEQAAFQPALHRGAMALMPILPESIADRITTREASPARLPADLPRVFPWQTTGVPEQLAGAGTGTGGPGRVLAEILAGRRP